MSSTIVTTTISTPNNNTTTVTNLSDNTTTNRTDNTLTNTAITIDMNNNAINNNITSATSKFSLLNKIDAYNILQF